MDGRAQELLDAYVEKYRASAPENWIRIVTWQAYLADEDGSVDRSVRISPQIAVLWEGDDLVGRHFVADPQAGFDVDDLDGALAGQPEEGWTRLEVEIDRDGAVRSHFSHEPARSVVDSASDPFYDEVHQYAQRHRDELLDLVARLRDAGSLPDGEPGAPDPRLLPPSQRPRAADAGTSERGGALGRIFGRR